ncbi:MAG: heme ABC exporter ATP-binding protein CcmA [Pseudomonadota bacterium]
MTLAVRDLAIGRGGRTLLAGVTFEVEGRAALAIRGRNGLGKTTLLRTLAGLTPPLAGTLAQAPEDCAYASHADGLKATLTVREHLAFWARIYGTEGGARALANYGLERLADVPCGALSAGQRRRAALARLSLSARPIWLLDEPMAALDRDGVAQLAAAIEDHLATGGLALIVTHGSLPFDCPSLDLGAFEAREADGADGFGEALA